MKQPARNSLLKDGLLNRRILTVSSYKENDAQDDVLDRITLRKDDKQV